MASPLPISLLLLNLLLFSSPAHGQNDGFDLGQEKKVHLHFFFHDILGGSNPTAIPVASANRATSSGFGSITMIDDPLTESQDASSKEIGRAQGMYSQASQSETGLLMTMNFAFTDGDYKGSSLAILGRNPVANDVREMPVVGGSGVFRWARGYALAKTRNFDPTTGDATVEYDVYVLGRTGQQKVSTTSTSSASPILPQSPVSVTSMGFRVSDSMSSTVGLLVCLLQWYCILLCSFLL